MAPWAWGAVVAVAVGGTAMASAVVLRAHAAERRGPIARAVAAAPAIERRVGRVRFVVTREAPAALLVDSAPPARDAQLMWLEGRSAAPTRDGSAVLDAAGGVVEFDRRLRPHQRAIRAEGREWLSVAAAPDSGFWLADATGALFRSDRGGTLHSAPPTGLHYAEVASDPHAGQPWLARSPRRFAYGFDTAPAPLLLGPDPDARSSGGDADARKTSARGAGASALRMRGVGHALKPEHILLADLANAGHLAVGDSVIFYAPFIRDELVAMTFAGETLWVASRALPQHTREPRFELHDGKAVIDYHPVNLGVVLGPDAMLYLLSTPGPTTEASRLDVFDPRTGALLRSVQFTTALPTLAADEEGRVYALDPFRVLAGVPPREREAVPAFELPALGGGSISRKAMLGQVVLVNLWASWCGPCRDEMPALDSLRREVTDPAFFFVALSDDVSETAARAFLQARGFDFSVALGHGTLRDQFHLPGLPVTILVDREGREVRRWIGYAGAEQIASIRALVRAELDRAPGTHVQHGTHQHGG